MLIVHNSFSNDQKIKSKQIDESDAKYVIFPAGRRYGKGEFAARKQLKKVIKMKSDPQSPHAWVAPTFRQAKLGFYKYSAFLKRNKIDFEPALTELHIDIFNSPQYRINFFSVDRPENMEGFAFRSFVVDESGIALQRRNVWENSIQPATIDFDATGMFIGTPKGRGLFEEMWLKGKNKDPNYLSLHATSYDNIIEKGGYVTKAAIDRIADDMPDIVKRQEIFAE